MELEGRAAIVTGAGTGVGRQTGFQLANQGCSVLVNYSRSKQGAEETAALCERRGVRAIAVRADLSKNDDCRAKVAEAERAFGRLDVLINNAGQTKFLAHDNLEGIDPADWTQILNVNLVGPFLCTRAARSWLQAGFGKAYDAIKAGILEKTPLKKVATPETVAAGILAILMGPDMTTGHVFPHEGGVTISI